MRTVTDCQSCTPIGFHKTDAASGWVLIKGQGIGIIGLPGVQLQNYQFTQAISVILALTGKKLFYVNKKSEAPPKNSKTSRGPY
jgi:hypothetical protein